MIDGVANRVAVRVAAIEDFLVMKAHALAGRDKSKDAYDICYCLDHAPLGIEEIATGWRTRRDDPDVAQAISNLRDKFASVDSYGPLQVVAFRDPGTLSEREMIARRSFELVRRLLALIDAYSDA